MFFPEYQQVENKTKEAKKMIFVKKCSYNPIVLTPRNALTILGQVQFNLSVRRHYMLRPYLKNHYSGLCSINTPITANLFRDDVSKEIKKCKVSVKVGKFFQPYRSHIRGRSFGGNRGYGPIRARGRGAYRTRPYGGQFGYHQQFTNNKSTSKPAAAASTTSSATVNPN